MVASRLLAYKKWTCALLRLNRMRSRYRITTHEQLYRRLATFCVLARVMHDFKGRKMNISCLFVCLSTMRLLLIVSHVILQRFAIITRFFGLILSWLATGIYNLHKHLCFRQQLTIDAAHLLLWHLLSHSTMSTEKCPKRVVYISL